MFDIYDHFIHFANTNKNLHHLTNSSKSVCQKQRNWPWANSIC